MGQLIFLFWSAFVIGLSGAMMPGPVLTATIGETLKRGFRAGPLIVLGHAILEMAILLMVVLGLGTWITLPPVKGGLGLAGGLLLAAMGVQMAWTAKSAVTQMTDATKATAASIRGPVLTGFLTSISNPYWWVWWATTGLYYAALALGAGWVGLISFYLGHILSDLAWYSLVSGAVHTGRRICPPLVYQILITICGVVLVGLGVYFFTDAVRLFLNR
jgi:threonine/homoserine/homoserine lactone efflux protein